MSTRALVATSLCILIAGCASERRYDIALARASALGAELKTRDAAVSDAIDDARRANARAARLQTELARADAERKLTSERDAARRAMLDRLLDVYRAIARELWSQPGADNVDVALRGGLLVFALPADEIFVSERDELKPSADIVLRAVAGVMRDLATWRFQVAGHTDDAAIKSKAFASSWELSTARALRLVHFFVKSGVVSAHLCAAGFADALPIDTNATDSGRKRNRRIEITFVPDLLLSEEAPPAL